jgi:hypothetical protein
MDAGGFDPDEGGFISDEGEGGGGFMEDHEEPNQVASNTKDTSTAEDEPLRIPLRNLPAALSSLNLPSDEDVLAVFRASASGWTEQTGRYRDKEEEEENRLIGGGVELKDFRAVCAALMGPDEGGDGEDQISDDGDEDIYQDEGGDDGESSLSEITEDEYNEPSTSAAKPGTVKDKGKGKGKGRKKKVELEDNGKIRLNPRQREVVNDLWGMLKPDSAREVRGGHILGRDEVRRKVRDLGEMWTEDEVSWSFLLLYFCRKMDGANDRLPKWLHSFLLSARVGGLAMMILEPSWSGLGLLSGGLICHQEEAWYRIPAWSLGRKTVNPCMTCPIHA